MENEVINNKITKNIPIYSGILKCIITNMDLSRKEKFEIFKTDI